MNRPLQYLRRRHVVNFLHRYLWFLFSHACTNISSQKPTFIPHPTTTQTHTYEIMFPPIYTFAHGKKSYLGCAPALEWQHDGRWATGCIQELVQCLSMKALSFSLSGSGSSHTPSFWGILAVKKKRLPNSNMHNKREGLRCEHATLFYRMRRARCRRREWYLLGV